MSLVPYEQLKWSDPRSSLLAGICIVTGFVNVWRFPELMATHGGEAFLLTYVGALVCPGIAGRLAAMAVRASIQGDPGRRACPSGAG
ncbi:MAG: hypothetical protein IPM37_23400 [Hahellaceae bacterium]|nr:hypothetical protein [Hahellaceae bacterium]